MIGLAPSRLRFLKLADRAPSGLVAAPTDLRAVDPYVAQELVYGRIALTGRILETGGASPFSLEMPSAAFEEKLHAFGWLRHVRASKSDEACARARFLVSDWIAHHGRRIKGVAWAPEIAAQRLIAWLSHSPVVLQNADAVFYRRFLKCLGYHVRYLSLIAKYAPDGEIRLKIRIALAVASISLPHRAVKIARFGVKLDRELERQVLPDGGHVSRNPRVMLDLLLDLLPLRQSYINLGHDVPPGLVPAIDRMFPAIRFFRHQDGDLALFNGATVTLANELASVLRYDETSGRPSRALPDVGYQRLSAGSTVVIVDTGLPQTLELSKGAHCGCLSFELSSVRNRFIVNSGFPPQAAKDFRRASRCTAAHSTVTLNDTSSSRLSRSRLLGPVMMPGITDVTVKRQTDQKGSDVLTASHDGYLSKLGYLHERELELNAAGTKIKGRDAVLFYQDGKKRTTLPVSAVSRFHIHPSINLVQVDQETVLMSAADGTGWLFSAPGQIVTIAEDVFMADASGIRPSQQIEIPFSPLDTPEVRWLIEKKP
ncbi:heparinase II/III family protein [Agrobacterium rosae]|uniref:Heparinase II/III family protein n=1 Tax=Agrobacterium rosae TaxID=1972867 RepID=A0AAW9FNT3_9HYPH|nr:heparinase II/III family protein [Agrobacterium rosae]MDX8304796.1 heparinase II/III family protein [Agrobacterium rosae]POO54548.1 heparinase [Agrobacterium rosae]